MITVEKVINDRELALVFAIRKEVFVQEQNCPAELEWEFEDESVHFIAYFDGLPCGAARWRQTQDGFKLERFAVLVAFRGKNIGQHLVQAVLEDLPKPNEQQKIYLHAQLSAMGLYSKFRFEKQGNQFEEAGIQHFKMVKTS